jgi:hypothetical protein
LKYCIWAYKKPCLRLQVPFRRDKIEFCKELPICFPKIVKY